jgi:peroxiredoxin
MLSVGDQAPAFELPDADMNVLSTEALAGKPYILYFYPKDDTPGCTVEALEFTDLMDDFLALGVAIIGASKDSCDSHGAFRDKYGLEVQLVADMDGQLCEAYGVWREKEKEGVKQMGILRSTFIVDGEGVIRHALYDVKPKGHAAAVLEMVKGL